MPSTTESTVQDGLRVSRVYSWGGNMDHLEIVVTCVTCGRIISDDFGALDEDEIPAHQAGRCDEREDPRIAAAEWERDFGQVDDGPF